MPSELLWTVGLAFANETFMLPVSIVYGFVEGTIRRKWQPVIWLCGLLVFSVIMSETLKSFFKVPLICNPTRYGFPSGHTQLATVFYGWICYQLSTSVPLYLRTLYTIVTLSILAYAVTAIVQSGYHTWFDIMGGFTVGSSILIFSILVNRLGRRENSSV